MLQPQYRFKKFLIGTDLTNVMILTSPRPKSNPNPKSKDLGCH